MAYVNPANVLVLDLDIEGMTCEACNHHVSHAAQEVPGVLEAHAHYKSGKAEVKFDTSVASREDIDMSINATSYKVSFTIYEVCDSIQAQFMVSGATLGALYRTMAGS